MFNHSERLIKVYDFTVYHPSISDAVKICIENHYGLIDGDGSSSSSEENVVRSPANDL